MERLLAIMRRLRGADGCPWDRQQTHASLRPYLLEEAAEAADALIAGDPAAMADELGDVLLQVAFHAVIAEEGGTFGYDDVEGAIVAKLIRRHPHVFGDGHAADADAVLRQWRDIKAAERGGAERAPADAVPRSLPALTRAARLGAALGWRADEVVRDRTIADVATDPAAIAAALTELAAAAAALGHDPELLLRDRLNARAGEGGGGS